MSPERSYRRDCPACGGSIPASARYCSKCGAEVRTETIVAKVTDEIPSTNVDEYAVPDSIVEAVGPGQSVYALIEDPDRPIRKVASIPALGFMFYAFAWPFFQAIPWVESLDKRDGVLAAEGELEVGEWVSAEVRPLDRDMAAWELVDAEEVDRP